MIRIKGKQWAVIALMAAFIYGAIVYGYQYFLERSPKNLYLLSEYKTYQANIDRMTGSELHRFIGEKPSSSRIELSGNFQMEGPDSKDTLTELEMIRTLLKKLTVSLQVNQDPLTAQTTASIKLLVGKMALLQTEMFQTQDVTALQIPVLYDKYFYVENDQFGRLVRRFDPSYEGPERLENLSQIRKSHREAHQQEAGDLLQDYATYLVSQLKEENVTLNKGVPYSTPSGQVKLRQLTVAFSEQEMDKIQKDLLDRMANDEELLTLAAQYLVNLTRLSPGELLPEVYQDEATIKQQLSKWLKKARTSLESIKFTDGFTMVVLIDKQNRIVDRNIMFSIQANESNNDQGWKLQYSSNQWSTKKQEQQVKRTLTLTPLGMSVTDTKHPLKTAGVASTIEVTTHKKQEREKEISESQISFILEGKNSPLAFHWISGWISGNLEKLGLSFTIRHEVQLRDRITFPTLDQQTAIHLTAISEQEWRSIQAEIEKKAQSLLMRNRHLLLPF